MPFLIANTFTESLASLTGDEQKAVKTNAFDLQMPPASPGLGFHKPNKAPQPRSADAMKMGQKIYTKIMQLYLELSINGYK